MSAQPTQDAQSEEGERVFESIDSLLRITAQITRAPLDVGGAHADVVHPSCGGVAGFVGTTRDNHNRRPVSRLEYEAHTALALPLMIKLGREVYERSGGELRRIFMAHRIGPVPVGEASIVITASSPHRPEALAAVSWLIDELKARVPVWKKEWYADDGSSAWKANSECCWGHVHARPGHDHEGGK